MSFATLSDAVSDISFWDFLTLIWELGIKFFSFEISFFNTGISFTLGQWMLGATVLSIAFYSIFRVLE